MSFCLLSFCPLSFAYVIFYILYTSILHMLCLFLYIHNKRMYIFFNFHNFTLPTDSNRYRQI